MSCSLPITTGLTSVSTLETPKGCGIIPFSNFPWLQFGLFYHFNICLKILTYKHLKEDK